MNDKELSDQQIPPDPHDPGPVEPVVPADLPSPEPDPYPVTDPIPPSEPQPPSTPEPFPGPPEPTPQFPPDVVF